LLFFSGLLLLAALLRQLCLPQTTIEAIDAPLRVYDTLLTREERMTGRADIRAYFW
jgi:hypothetical protein